MGRAGRRGRHRPIYSRDSASGRGHLRGHRRQQSPGRVARNRRSDLENRMAGAMMRIPFNRPHIVGREFEYIQQTILNGHLSGNGAFTKKCQSWIEARVGCARALLTHSCTAALEMAALLAGVGPGDEVIMPSFTFVSTANAFVLRGARPVFVDVRADTLNLDESKVEAAITGRTRAIVPVHYAGVACEMDALCAIAARHRLLIVEDAAQGVEATYTGRPLG